MVSKNSIAGEETGPQAETRILSASPPKTGAPALSRGHPRDVSLSRLCPALLCLDSYALAGSGAGLKGIRYPEGAEPHLGEALLQLPYGGATLDTMAFPRDMQGPG